MTRDDVIRMAREAGIVTGENLKFSEGYRYRSVGSPTNVREQCLLDFATMVAAAEREACMKLCEDMGDNWDCHQAIVARGRPKTDLKAV